MQQKDLDNGGGLSALDDLLLFCQFLTQSLSVHNATLALLFPQIR